MKVGWEEVYSCVHALNKHHFVLEYIIFGATNEHFYEEFSKMKQAVFEMSMVEELKFFLGL